MISHSLLSLSLSEKNHFGGEPGSPLFLSRASRRTLSKAGWNEARGVTTLAGEGGRVGAARAPGGRGVELPKANSRSADVWGGRDGCRGRRRLAAAGVTAWGVAAAHAARALGGGWRRVRRRSNPCSAGRRLTFRSGREWREPRRFGAGWFGGGGRAGCRLQHTMRRQVKCGAAVGGRGGDPLGVPRRQVGAPHFA